MESTTAIFSRRQLALVVGALLSFSIVAKAASLEDSFQHPPDSARPWVYWFWLNGNITREGITADLEAMKRVGIGGVLIMEVDQGSPPGKVAFMSDLWREMFKHVVSEAGRLGLEVNMNNDAGWDGSGGPWVPLDKAMQVVVSSEARVSGGVQIHQMLPRPMARSGYYQDISVMAFPTPQAELRPAVGAEGKQVYLPPNGPYGPCFQLELQRPFNAGGLELSVDNFTKPFTATLQVSDDGRSVRGVNEFEVTGPHVSTQFPGVTARVFRVLMNDKAIKTGSIRLHQGPVALDDLVSKSDAWGHVYNRNVSDAPNVRPVPADAIVAGDQSIDLTGKMDKDGLLLWDAPPGDWTLMRFGHTFSGATNNPGVPGGTGPECDKLSKQGIDAHFNGMIARLIADVGPAAGKTFAATHIDSWEIGAQNWTADMPAEFARRRGYDLSRYLPVIAGRIVDSQEKSLRFLWDLRQTVSELLTENYVGHLAELAHAHGLRLSMEVYTTPANDMDVANVVDEPMCEFWYPETNLWFSYSPKSMSSAAHTNGRRIVGAESFTSTQVERWLAYPAILKGQADRAFSRGVNRIVVHRYAMQPWTDDRKPGMSMGPYGIHFERTQTWWEQSIAWNTYVARCQQMLRQGNFVADALDLQAEGALLRYSPRTIRGYDYDACSPQLFLKDATVKNGMISLSSGMQYRLVILPDGRPMTVPMIRKIRDLVTSGAAILGEPPSATPGLTNYPDADVELKQIAGELWGDDPGVTDRAVGRGRVFRGIKAEEALAKLNVHPDFISDGNLMEIHRRLDDGTEIYFLASDSDRSKNALCEFRVVGKQPELWQADTGQITAIGAYEPRAETTCIPLHFDPRGSCFILFRNSSPSSDPVTLILCDGKPVLPATQPVIDLKILHATYGSPGDEVDVTARLQSKVDVTGLHMIAGDDLGGNPSSHDVKTLRVEYTLEGHPAKAAFRAGDLSRAGDWVNIPADIDTLRQAPAENNPEAILRTGQPPLLTVWNNGLFTAATASGRTYRGRVDSLEAPMEITGSWEVDFPPHLGAPAHATFPKLISWSECNDPGIQYFSGTATYTKAFDLPASFVAGGRRQYLDLGQVQVMCDVKLNGKDLGILWKKPYRIEISDAVHTGENHLEIGAVNLWPNRLIGDEQLPEDSDRNPDGTLKRWPDWLEQGRPSPTGRIAFPMWRLWKKSESLLPSGLLVPVKIYASDTVPTERE